MPENQNVFVVTTPFVPNYEIKEVKGLVWASSVKAKFILEDIIATFRILLGGNIPEYWHLIDEARREVLRELTENAKKMDADAVISFKLMSSQIVPGTIEIMGYGTAVKLK
ncbi:MAG: YbjQ family protein [Candidatus Diapherotrites archaeon]